MKLIPTLLFSLLIILPAAAWADAPTAPETAPIVTELAVPAFLSIAAEGDCEGSSEGLITSGTPQEGTEAANQSCGSCSSPNCNGATRGQICNTGQGWGHCNIFSGGYMCSTGGWECQCEMGPLP